MFREIGQLTPKEILINLGLHVEKPRPNSLVLDNSIKSIPVSNAKTLRLSGCGDWDRSRSSEGSAVITNTDANYVLKFPVGELYQTGKVMEKARSMSQTAKLYSKSSPQTSFFIAQIDGTDSQPKVITFQTKNDEKPTCDMKLHDIFKQDIINQFDKITALFISNLKISGAVDCEGLMFNSSNGLKKLLAKLICDIPLFSDNTMISNNGIVQITDNTPDSVIHFVKNDFKKFLKVSRIKVSWAIVKYVSKLLFSISKN